MPLSRDYMQTLQNTFSTQKRDALAIDQMVLEIENGAMDAARLFGSSFYEFYEYKQDKILDRLRTEVHRRLREVFVGCRVLHTEHGFYLSWA
jgi:PhoPQ-activated pathogenicity-related protein